MIFYCSRPLRIFSRLPSKLVPATALQGLARFQVLLAELFTSPWWTISPKAWTISPKASTTALYHVRKSRPSTLNELKAVVEAFAESVDQGEVKRSARSTWKCARACKAVTSASFESSLEKILRGLKQKISKCPIKLFLEITQKINFCGMEV